MTLKNKLIAQAKELGLKTDKLTIVQLKAAIKAATDRDDAPPAKEGDSGREAAGQTEPADAEAADEEVKFAKAGKRSKKSVLAAEEEAARQSRKQEDAAAPPPVKKAVTPTRPRSERRSKKYKDAAKQVDKQKTYETGEALALIIKTSTTKFDSSVDLVCRLGVNPKQADHNIRDFVILPAGLGKDLRIAVFADDKEAEQAVAAGAAVAGKEVFLQQLDKGAVDFDVLIAVPQLMASLSKYAKLLGPKGLMPNPKSGTVTKDVVKAVKEAKAGRVEYRADENGLVHLSIGKVSFGADKLKENFEAVLGSLRDNRPASLKGTYIQSIHLSTTMGRASASPCPPKSLQLKN